MIKLPKNKTRAIGVSNHSIEHVGHSIAEMFRTDLHRSKP